MERVGFLLSQVCGILATKFRRAQIIAYSFHEVNEIDYYSFDT